MGGSLAANRHGSAVTSNAAMLHLLAREDGTLLKTDVPARAVDITWLNRVFNSSDTDAARAELWTGSTHISGIEYGTIFASSHSTPIHPSFRDLHLPDVDSMMWSFNTSRFPSPLPTPPPGPPAPCNRKPQPCPNEPGHTFCPSDPRAGQCQDKPVKDCPPCPPPPPPALQVCSRSNGWTQLTELGLIHSSACYALLCSALLCLLTHRADAGARHCARTHHASADAT